MSATIERQTSNTILVVNARTARVKMTVPLEAKMTVPLEALLLKASPVEFEKCVCVRLHSENS